MTATPIPRTLHMSIVGMRDMSVIYEPPQNRIPVQTYVLEYDPEVIKEAVTRELERGGQVFYLFNNVEGIEKKALEINELVEEAKVEYAHGKMTGNQLENIMQDFVDGKSNVLVCTTILESGIDIPNANTIIVENADRLIYTNRLFNTKFYDAKYVGWMFGGAQGQASTSKAQGQTNETDSEMKILVDSWYKTNIVDKNLGDKVSDTLFCNDRTTPGKDATGNTSDTGLGYGSQYTAYGATARTNVWNTDASKVQPRFTCPQKNDAFTVSDETNGNGDLTYPVGLITADEIVAAGSGKYGISNSSYYLYKGSWYWSLSPLYFNSHANPFIVGTSWNLHGTNVLNTGGAVAPVINLKAEYVQTMIGDGTINNPYRDINDIL